MKLEKLTASSIRDWRANPKLFYYRHICRLELPQKQMNLLFGGAIHKGIEEFYDHESEEKAIKAFEGKFDYTKLTPEEFPEYGPHLQEGRRLLAKFIESQDYLEAVWGISREGKSEMRFRDTEWVHPLTGERFDVPVTGIVDRHTMDGDVIEFKTASKPYKDGEIDDLVQPTVYSHWYLTQYKRIPKRTVYIVMVKGREEPIQVLETTRGIADFIQLQEEMKLIKDSVERNHFPNKRSGFFNEVEKYEELLKI